MKNKKDEFVALETATDNINEEGKNEQKHVKNVDVKQCIYTLVICVLILIVAFIPLTFGSAGYNLAIKSLPVVGEESSKIYLANAIQSGVEGFLMIVGLNTASYVNLFDKIFAFATYGFYIAIIIDFSMALLLLILRSELLRIIFKMISIVLGFFMIATLLLFIVEFFGIFGHLIMGAVAVEDFLTFIETTGILYSLGMIIASAIMIKRQFVWFSRLY